MRCPTWPPEPAACLSKFLLASRAQRWHARARIWQRLFGAENLPMRGKVSAVITSIVYLASLVAICLPPADAFAAEPPRIFPAGTLPNDSRLGPLKDFDGYFPMTPPKTRDEWLARAERVRRQILVAAGLWPLPEKTPLNAVVHGRVERPGYTVERVFFESYPGHFVTGSLFRPTDKTGRLPGRALSAWSHAQWPLWRQRPRGRAARDRRRSRALRKWPP